MANNRTLIEDLMDAFKGPVPEKCPLLKKEYPKSDIPVYDIPEPLRGLVLVYVTRKGIADRLATGHGDDGGVWYRASLEADAVLVIINEGLRVHSGASRRSYFEILPGWKYTKGGA